MCAYKVCRVEFKFWGMQGKIERFIHDSALRRVMLRAHRQAWSWQDEWIDLTMDDIRKLEKETQEHLAKKMANSEEAESNILSGDEINTGDNSLDRTTGVKNANLASIGTTRKQSIKSTDAACSDDEFLDAE